MNAQDELDGVLQALRAQMPDAHQDGQAPAADEALAAARTRLLAEIGSAPPVIPVRRRRRWPTLAIAASIVVAVVVGAMLVGLPGTGPASAEARAVLEQAARSTITVVDPPLGPGQYRYIGTHAWWLSGGAGEGSAPLTALVENRIEYWVPADPAAEWLMVSGATGRFTPVQGTEAELRASGVLDGYSTERITARCGDFYGGSNQCTGPGSWQAPTPEFLAGLPRDPDELFERLDEDAPDNSRGDAELLVYAADLLRNPLLVPADLRSALYEALTRVNGLTVTPGAVNLDGQAGTALGIDDATSRTEIIIDPATGTFIGEREVAITDTEGLPAGTLIAQTSVTSAVVDAIGEPPAG